MNDLFQFVLSSHSECDSKQMSVCVCVCLSVCVFVSVSVCDIHYSHFIRLNIRSHTCVLITETSLQGQNSGSFVIISTGNLLTGSLNRP